MKKIHIDNMQCRKRTGSFIAVVCGFESEVTAIVNGRKLNGKSIMNVLTIDRADKLDFVFDGIDEKGAVDAICDYFNMGNAAEEK